MFKWSSKERWGQNTSRLVTAGVLMATGRSVIFVLFKYKESSNTYNVDIELNPWKGFDPFERTKLRSVIMCEIVSSRALIEPV